MQRAGGAPPCGAAAGPLLPSPAGVQSRPRVHPSRQALTASISRWRLILSATTAPPFCIGALKLTLKSRRLISPAGVNPGLLPPQGAAPKPFSPWGSGAPLVTRLGGGSPPGGYALFFA